jgi:hypothetical protein
LKIMGGLGSGRTGGRPTVESARQLDIDRMIAWGAIRPGDHLAGEMTYNFYEEEIAIKFESLVGDPWDSWLRLKYRIHDYWSGEPYEIDDKIYLATTQPPFGDCGGGSCAPAGTGGYASSTYLLVAITFGLVASIVSRMPPSAKPCTTELLGGEEAMPSPRR